MEVSFQETHIPVGMSEQNELAKQLAILRAENDRLKSENANLTKEHEVIRKERDLLYQQKDELNLQLEEALDLAGIDFLMNIHNRREGERRAKSLIAQAYRGEITIAYVRMDIDNFKKLNDDYGHAWGDDRLRSAAEVLRNAIRETDEIFRFGGEEIDFVLTFKNGTNMQDIGLAVNRLRDAIIQLKRQPPYIKNGEDAPMTGSFGVRIVGPGDVPVDLDKQVQLLNIQSKADKASYQSKAGGRDQIKIYMDEKNYYQPPKTKELFQARIF